MRGASGGRGLRRAICQFLNLGRVLPVRSSPSGHFLWSPLVLASDREAAHHIVRVILRVISSLEAARSGIRVFQSGDEEIFTRHSRSLHQGEL